MCCDQQFCVCSFFFACACAVAGAQPRRRQTATACFYFIHSTVSRSAISYNIFLCQQFVSCSSTHSNLGHERAIRFFPFVFFFFGVLRSCASVFFFIFYALGLCFMLFVVFRSGCTIHLAVVVVLFCYRICPNILPAFYVVKLTELNVQIFFQWTRKNTLRLRQHAE